MGFFFLQGSTRLINCSSDDLWEKTSARSCSFAVKGFVWVDNALFYEAVRIITFWSCSAQPLR